MRWPRPWKRAPQVIDRRAQALDVLETSARRLNATREHGRRVDGIYAALMHEAHVNHFTERWQHAMHPREGT